MSSALDKVQGLLGKKIRVLISDGRMVQGELQCIDKDLNIILNSAVEYYGIEDVNCKEIPSDHISRNLGMAMLPGNHVTKVLTLGDAV